MNKKDLVIHPKKESLKIQIENKAKIFCLNLNK